MPRIAVFGGVSANPWALEAVLADARDRGCEERFGLGDLGGFGAACDEVRAPLLCEDVTCTTGTCDLAIGRRDEDCSCGCTDERDNRFAQVMDDHTRAHASADFVAWMRTLPDELGLERGGRDLHLVHGSPLAVDDVFWESLDEADARLRVRASGADALLCTRTGIPWQREVDGTLVVDVGASGRPADGGRREVGCAVLDVEAGRARAELRQADGALPEAFGCAV